MRAGLGGGQRLGGQVVDLVLAFLHAANVIGQRHRFFIDRGGAEAQQLGDAFLVALILADAFLQHAAEVFPHLGVIFLAVLGEVVEQVEHLAHAAAANHFHVARLLQNFARDVERQIGGIDNATDEAQIGRHQLARVFHDEHALDVQLDACLGIAVPQVERRVRRHVQQRGVVLAAFDLDVGPGHRVFVIVADVFVERLVFVFGDIVFRARPQRIGAVDGFHLVLLVLGFVVDEFDRNRDMVGILANHRFQTPGVEEFGFVGFHVQRDLSAAIGLFDRFQCVLAGAFRFPAHTVLLRQSRTAGGHSDTVSDDEAGIETDAELTDQLRVFLLVTAEFAEKLARAGFGDGTDVFDDFLTVHADAVVTNGDRLGILVDADLDLQFGVGFKQCSVGQRFEAQLVGGV